MSLETRCRYGSTLHARRVAPSRWEIELPTLEPVCLVYTLEARLLTVRTNYLDPDFASLCLPAVVMLIEGQRWSTHHLHLVLPSGWFGHVPLPSDDGVYEARDFDHLVDAPVHAGPFQSNQFSKLFNE